MPSRFATFLSDAGGTAVVLFGVLLVPLFGFLGGAVDYGKSLQVRTHLQEAADAAALAAASLEPNARESERVSVGKDVFQANLMSGIKTTPAISVNEDKVTVDAEASVPTYLLGIVNIDAFDVAASATALRTQLVGPACVLALDPVKKAALSLTGTADLAAKNCVVHANSSSKEAMTAVGASSAAAKDFCTVGGYSGDGFSPEPYENCNHVPDPFADMPKPLSSGCDYVNTLFNKGTHEIEPGVYCGGIEIKAHADVTLAPGIYVIKDGPLHIRSHGSIAGKDVMFYLTGYNAVLDLAGGGDMTVTAPYSGPYAGFAFFQDPDTKSGARSYLRGGGNLEIVGAIYLPTQVLEVAGQGEIGSKSPFMPLIANNFLFRGNAFVSVELDADAAGMPDLMPLVHAGGARLIN